MKTKEKILLIIIFCCWLAGLLFILAQASSESVLQPKGVIASRERDLMYFAGALSLVIIIPVFALIFGIAWRYRESNQTAKYNPNWDHSRLYETIWWGVPTLLIIILSIVTFKTSHELDPSKPIQSSQPAMTIQVVAMDWKWLFIYPDEQIATVNYVNMPVNTPINFKITGDSAMNSFWIPSLGGQIYAMAGMSTQINLQASETGEYRGSSANISGKGFAKMDFIVNVTSQDGHQEWIKAVKAVNNMLDSDEYNKLAQPSINHPPAYYSVVKDDLFLNIINRYLLPS